MTGAGGRALDSVSEMFCAPADEELDVTTVEHLPQYVVLPLLNVYHDTITSSFRSIDK